MGVSSEVGIGSFNLLASNLKVFSVRYQESSQYLFLLVIISSFSKVKMQSFVKFKMAFSYLLILRSFSVTSGFPDCVKNIRSCFRGSVLQQLCYPL